MNENIDAAKVGKMYVTRIGFQWHEGGSVYNDKTHKYDMKPGRWEINASLCDKPTQYGNSTIMSFSVEHGIGQKLAEVLLPVIVADASQKAQQLADDSKAMIQALGERALTCIADMPPEQKS